MALEEIIARHLGLWPEAAEGHWFWHSTRPEGHPAPRCLAVAQFGNDNCLTLFRAGRCYNFSVSDPAFLDQIAAWVRRRGFLPRSVQNTPPTQGTSVFICRPRLEGAAPRVEILVGQRHASCRRAPGCFGLPGGMVEPGETLLECARREVWEETDLDVELAPAQEFASPILGVSDHRPRENHLTFWIMAQHRGGEPRVCEPTKHVDWQWRRPSWVFQHVPQEGEQRFWTPHQAWQEMFRRLNLTLEGTPCVTP